MIDHLVQRLPELKQMGAAQLQLMLLRLECGPFRIVQVWRSAVFNVSSQDVRDPSGLGELYESVNALDKGTRVTYVETTRIQRVSRQQDAGSSVI